MIKKYTPLMAYPFKSDTSFIRPRQALPERVTLDDHSSSVMTDLKIVSMINVRINTSMEKANAKMIHYGVRMLLVLDDADKVVGLITATDILGEKPIRFLENMGGTHADIQVRDIMTTQRELEVLKLQDVKNAKVGHIVATLKQAGRQHAIVVEESSDGNQAVCGLFSATQIARQLGVQTQTTDITQTFAKIEELLGTR